MPQPTDSDNARELRHAARLLAALAGAFAVLGGAVVAVQAERLPAPGTALVHAGAPAGAAAPAAPAATAASEPAPATATDGPVVVVVSMGEFFFSPRAITVPAGRPVTFRVSNPGVVDHELVIGDGHAQAEAEKAMAGSSHAKAGHSHGARPGIYLQPGAQGEFTATFDQPGQLLTGCHVPGHWAAGMRGTLQVA